MPFDGNGNYTRVHNWQQDAANNLDISASEMDAEDNSIAAAFNNTLTRDNQGAPTADFNPSADNVYNLGTGGTGVNARRWASINGTLLSNYLTSSNFGTFENPQTKAELAISVVPSSPAFYAYSATPKIDPRRYGAVGDGTTDDTFAYQTALNVMMAGKGRIMIPEDFVSVVGPLTAVFSGTDSTNVSAVIEGASQTGSRLIYKPPGTTSPSAMFSFSSSAPLSGTPQVAQLILENFYLDNTANTLTTGVYAMTVQGLAFVRISGVQCRGWDVGVDLLNSLCILIDQQCQMLSNNIGVQSRRTTTTQLNNVIKIASCRLNNNNTWGVAFGGGSLLILEDNDIEQNGVTGNVATGGVFTGADLSGNFGLAKVEMRGNWLEANKGAGVVISPLSSGALYFSMKGGQIISTNAGDALYVGTSGSPITASLIEDCYSPSSGDTWNVYANQSAMRNVRVATLTDGSTFKAYENVGTSAGLITAGSSIKGNFTATVTGISGTTTGTVTYSINGDTVTLNIPAISGTSTSASMTLTGIPAALYPNGNRYFTVNVADPSGVGQFIEAAVLSNTGVITFNGPLAGFVFTATGATKGLYGATLTYTLT